MNKFLSTLVLSLSFLFLSTICFGSETTPQLYTAPEFSLVDQDGAEFKSKSLQGKVWIADFFYTSCLHECLMMTTRLQNIQGHLKDLKNIQILSLSTDPKTDTPKVLKNYAKKHKIDESNWHLLRGDKKVIVELASKGFKLSADPKTAVHSQKFILVDAKGMIRGYYDAASKDDMTKLESDTRVVAK